jgi:hypothetical protein
MWRNLLVTEVWYSHAAYWPWLACTVPCICMQHSGHLLLSLAYAVCAASLLLLLLVLRSFKADPRWPASERVTHCILPCWCTRFHSPWWS